MILNTIIIIISIVISGIILLLAEWRWRMALLAVVQLIGFILIVQIWPVALASVKLISGWMGVALMSATMASSDNIIQGESQPAAKVFKLMIAAFSWVVIAASIDRLNAWLPISYTNLFVGLIFFFCGIFYLSLISEINGIVFGLLIFLAGFDIIYSSLEGSALVTGIYGLIVILISFVSSILQGGFSFGGSD
ncbi:MAG: hypothetical protein MUO42_02030 [Anaerolineaceae bacterium]|nr:hypothetical protein [Anaerolineaceae bacterium]